MWTTIYSWTYTHEACAAKKAEVGPWMTPVTRSLYGYRGCVEMPAICLPVGSGDGVILLGEQQYMSRM